MQGIDDKLFAYKDEFSKESRYPEHPISKHVPKHYTKEDLMSKRRESNRLKIDMITKSFMDKRQVNQSLEQPFI